MSKEKVVLAYSGGLDTSYCVKHLSEDKGLEVHAILVNTGGFSSDQLSIALEKAITLGAVHCEVIHQTESFYQKCVRYLIFGNVLRNQTYPLSVSAERVFQAMAIANYANSIDADYVAHGSTGAGNDQVRFDLVFEILCPEKKILTPIRDQQLSREAEIDYLKSNGVKMEWHKAQYSVNQGLWGTSVGGSETLTSHLPLPEDAYPSQLKDQESKTLQLHFKEGELVGIDDQTFNSPVEAIEQLQSLSAPYAIGRDTHVGDTIIGIKGRVGFEAAAPLIIIKAHHLLEKHTLGKWQAYWKEQLANWYGMMIHEGQYLDPVMRDIEQFLVHSQANVTGQVGVKLMPYRFDLLGIESPNDLMASKFGDYGEMNKAWSGDDVKGFTKILANQNKIYHAIHQNND